MLFSLPPRCFAMTTRACSPYAWFSGGDINLCLNLAAVLRLEGRKDLVADDVVEGAVIGRHIQCSVLRLRRSAESRTGQHRQSNDRDPHDPPPPSSLNEALHRGTSGSNRIIGRDAI